jgi:hypothetical protein
MAASGAAPPVGQGDSIGDRRDGELLGHGDQLGPGAVTDGGVGVQQKAEDPVAGLEAAEGGGAGLLDTPA